MMHGKKKIKLIFRRTPFCQAKIPNSSVADFTCIFRWKREGKEQKLVGPLEKASHNPNIQLLFSSYTIV